MNKLPVLIFSCVLLAGCERDYVYYATKHMAAYDRCVTKQLKSPKEYRKALKDMFPDSDNIAYRHATYIFWFSETVCSSYFKDGGNR